jgi:hypothetical protein
MLFGSCLTKKPDFGILEMEKGTFHRMKQKSASVVFLSIQRDTRVSDIASFLQTMP